MLNALQSFNSCTGLWHQVIFVITDDLSCVNIIIPLGPYDIFGYCFTGDISIEVQWRPREEDTFADYLSKLQDQDDWMVNNCEKVQRLNDFWKPFDIVNFASRTNHQIFRYYSRIFMPGTAGVDDFWYHWEEDMLWANPTFSACCFRHAHLSKARIWLIVLL